MLSGLILLVLVESGALEERVEIHLMGVKVRAVHAGELGLSAHDDGDDVVIAANAAADKMSALFEKLIESL